MRMDFRVLTAVFLTLLAIAVGMSEGGLSSEDVLGALKDVRRPSVDGLFDGATERPANTTVSARLDAAELSLEVGRPADLTLTVDAGTPVTVGDSTLTVARNGTVRFSRFTGSVAATRDNMTVAGTAREVAVGQFTFNYSSPTVVELSGRTVSRLSVVGVTDQTLSFQDASGAVNASGTGIAVDDERAVFQGFDGNVTVDAARTIVLEGRVHRAVLGEVQVGAE